MNDHVRPRGAACPIHHFSRLTGLAGSDETNRGNLQEHCEFSQARTVRINPTDPSGCSFCASNIAEGKGHHSDKEFVRFLLHARGSLLELQTQLLIAEDLVYLSKENSRILLNKTEAIGRALNGLINSMTKIAA
jgi:hypothetical protein